MKQRFTHYPFIRYLLFISSLVFIQYQAIAASFTLQSPDTKVNILEVYTSQGCSSCPPAERWLSKFENDPRLWKQFIPVNFHVDYWDYIGWKDPFANPKFSSRQRLYEQLELSRNVATPGFILNGRGWNGWFYGQNPKIEKQAVSGTITANINDDQIQLEFDSGADSDALNRLNVHVAILGFDVEIKVTGGENNGRHLTHDFVVLAYDSQYMSKIDGVAKAKLNLPDASKYKENKKAIVVWVSDRANPSPIQAVGNWL